MNSADETDADRVAKTLRGDREAFARLYDRYAKIVRAIVFATDHNRDACEDRTQESFLRAYRQLNTLNDPAKFGAWVAGIARQVAREHARVRRPPSLNGSVAAQTPPGLPVDKEDELDHLRGLVSQLPEEERIAVHAFFLNEQDVTSTSALLNRSRSGTYAILQRAIKRLAQWFGAQDRSEDAKR